ASGEASDAGSAGELGNRLDEEPELELRHREVTQFVLEVSGRRSGRSNAAGLTTFGPAGLGGLRVGCVLHGRILGAAGPVDRSPGRWFTGQLHVFIQLRSRA